VYSLLCAGEQSSPIHVKEILPMCSYRRIGITNQWFGIFTFAKHRSVFVDCRPYLGDFALRNTVYFLEGRLD